MHEIEATHAWPQQSTRGRVRRIPGHWLFLSCALLGLVLLALLPPLISINRYQRRIATSIGASIGRPVHFDHVALNLLPLPSFTIQNFVVEEAPAFGSEPIIRANTVTATLRFSSLWRRRVEFTRISFTEPSINLVHDASGRWNLGAILAQASRIEALPTAQTSAGASPRFPYIEATGARVNLKEGAEKTPFSLTEADLALWLPSPQQWRLRLKGRPVRTDANVTDTGTLQMEATLGRATELGLVPLAVQAAWRDAPLGAASRLFYGRDLGLRGDLSLTAALSGSLDQSALQTRVRINGLRRSDFVPEHQLSLDLDCAGSATRIFRSVENIRCSWPLPDSDGATIALAGSIPDLHHIDSADLQLGTSRLPASVLLSWIRVISDRTPATTTATGQISGSIAHQATPGAGWTGQLSFPQLILSGATLGDTPVEIAGSTLRSADLAPEPRRPHPPSAAAHTFSLAPTQITLGGREPVQIEASVDTSGYTLHLTGMAVPSRLRALGTAVPQFGDDLEQVLPPARTGAPSTPDPATSPATPAASTNAIRPSAADLPDHSDTPIRIDLTAHRNWEGDQVWTDNLAHPPALPPRGPARTATRTLR